MRDRPQDFAGASRGVQLKLTAALVSKWTKEANFNFSSTKVLRLSLMQLQIQDRDFRHCGCFSQAA